MVQQNCARFYDSIVYDREFNGIVDNDTEGLRLGKLFKQNTKNRIMSMRHHGVIVVGPTCAQAMEDLYYFEISCRLQVELKNMGHSIRKCAMTDEQAKGVYDQTMEDPCR